MNHDTIKQEAVERGCKVDDLLALARVNDPFYLGQTRQIKQAEWFADIWERSGIRTGHLRRVHYWLISQPDPRWYNGTPYENTDNMWKYLCEAGKYARYLNLIPEGVMIDRRNPKPHLFANYEDRPEPSYRIDVDPWRMPGVRTGYFDRPEYEITGYGYSNSDQPYHLEVWCEKSTMDDVLLPICRRYSANLITGEGEMSITAVADLLKRMEVVQRPARIFYISDYDPAGLSIPVAVARKIEYLGQQSGFEIKLNPIVLTEEQLLHYGDLPRTPIKEKDRRKDNFEERRGEGAVELDALEAIHPGELAKIVEGALDPWFDHDIQDQLMDAKHTAAEIVSESIEDATEDIEAEVSEIEDQIRAVMTRHTTLLDELSPLIHKLRELEQRQKDVVANIDAEIPERPVLGAPAGEHHDWLFDTERDYWEQLARYREHQRKDGADT